MTPTVFLILLVGLLSFSNGANDNFKGVATLWGAGATDYKRGLAWATVFTFFGSLAAIWAARGMAAKFNGSSLVAEQIYTQVPFLLAVILGAAATVLIASRVGLPISTTHSLTGALVGAGIAAAGFSHVKFVALGTGVVLPLLFSPVVALLLTLVIYPLVARMVRAAGDRDCVCIDEPSAVAVQAAAVGAALTVETHPAPSVPSVRWAPAAECDTGAEQLRWSVSNVLHWFSAAAISFARGLNDTPKVAAALLVMPLVGVKLNFFYAALAIAVGGILGARRVARTLSKEITPMATHQAVTANLVAAVLVALASPLALPVSTTHVTSGGLFGIGMLRRGEANWRRVWDILLSWIGTLPVAAVLAAACYLLLRR